MEHIIKYSNFNESRGISTSCENILYNIWNDIEADILSKKSNCITVDIDELDFKVKNIKIHYKIETDKNNICNATTKLGATVIDNYLTNISINLNIKIFEIDDEFVYYIKSIIFHELLHIFQHYNIIINKKFRPESFSIGVVLPQLRNIIKTDYGKYILDILYFSLSHELSAQIHQYYLYRNKHIVYQKIFNIKNILSDFEIRELDKNENDEISIIKMHILKSITFYTTNSNYNKNIQKSIWNESDNIIFLNKLKTIIDKKLVWINKKIKLIDSNFESLITYETNNTLLTNWDEHEINDIYEYNDYIKENLSDLKLMDNM